MNVTDASLTMIEYGSSDCRNRRYRRLGGRFFAASRRMGLLYRAALAIFGALTALSAACTAQDNSILTADQIQATVNAIVTASAHTPEANSDPAPFRVSQPVNSSWQTDVVRIEPRQISIGSVQWNDDSVVKFVTSQGTYLLDASEWGFWDRAWNTSAAGNQLILPSPDGRHHILIENHMWIVRNFDGNPIGLIGDVPDAVAWTLDGSAVVFAITDQASELQRGLYSWSVDNPRPSLVYSEPSIASRVILSPQGSQAAYLVNSNSMDQVTLQLVAIPSGEAETRQLDLAHGWRIERWVSEDLIEFSYGLSLHSYAWYNLSSQAVFEIQSEIAAASRIDPLPSPDGQWIAAHDIQVNEGDAGEMATDLVEDLYFVADLGTQENHTLAYGGDSAIEYLTWSPDSRWLYLVSCPTSEEAQPPPELPFGLVAFDPETSTSELLFGKVLQASLSPTQQWAYVVFPSLDSDDGRTLTGGLWEIGSDSLLQRRMILNEFIYRNPTARGGQDPAAYIYASWAHDGEHLVVVDPQGVVMLYDLNGQAQVLHTGLFEDLSTWVEGMERLRLGGLYWSPDDRYLLVDFGDIYLVRLE